MTLANGKNSEDEKAQFCAFAANWLIINRLAASSAIGVYEGEHVVGENQANHKNAFVRSFL